MDKAMAKPIEALFLLAFAPQPNRHQMFGSLELTDLLDVEDKSDRYKYSL
jgi:hypothetical protein